MTLNAKQVFSKKSALFLTFMLCIQFSKAQPGMVNMTPVIPIDGGLVNSKLKVPYKFRTQIDSTYSLNLPQGYQASVFYMGGLSKPRALEFSPAGVLHVVDFKLNGAVYAMPDINMDDVADTLVPVVSGVYAHDFKFYKKDIYVAEEKRILKCSDLNQDGFFETKTVFIDSLGQHSNDPSGGHKSRTILFDTLRQKIFVSIGSSCNVCRDEERAVIEQYNMDGTGRKIYAFGIRNSVGMALNPMDNQLWANNNGSDQQGNNIPPEWIDQIKENVHYGFPFAYGNQVWFNMDAHPDYQALKPITASDSAKVARMKEPAGLIQAHSAPMELEWTYFISYNDFIGFLSALHGSWNRTPATGFKVVFLDIDPNNPDKINKVSDVITGFLSDSINRVYWGRPVGLALKQYPLKNPDIFMSSDEVNRFILKIKCEGGFCHYVGLKEENLPKQFFYPNPFGNEIQFSTAFPNHADIFLMDLSGRSYPFDWDSNHSKIIVSGLPEGMYILQMKTEQGLFTQKLIHSNAE